MYFNSTLHRNGQFEFVLCFTDIGFFRDVFTIQICSHLSYKWISFHFMHPVFLFSLQRMGDSYSKIFLSNTIFFTVVSTFSYYCTYSSVLWFALLNSLGIMPWETKFYTAKSTVLFAVVCHTINIFHDNSNTFESTDETGTVISTRGWK